MSVTAPRTDLALTSLTKRQWSVTIKRFAITFGLIFGISALIASLDDYSDASDVIFSGLGVYALYLLASFVIILSLIHI